MITGNHFRCNVVLNRIFPEETEAPSEAPHLHSALRRLWYLTETRHGICKLLTDSIQPLYLTWNYRKSHSYCCTWSLSWVLKDNQPVTNNLQTICNDHRVFDGNFSKNISIAIQLTTETLSLDSVDINTLLKIKKSKKCLVQMRLL